MNLATCSLKAGTMAHHLRLKSLLIGNASKGTAIGEAPAVKRTNKNFAITPLLRQQARAPMRADIIKGDNTVRRVRNDERLVSDTK